MCCLTRLYITFLIRKRFLQSMLLLMSQDTSLFKTTFILFSWVLLTWRKAAIFVIKKKKKILISCWLQAGSGFLRDVCKNQFWPLCCTPSAAPILLPPIPSPAAAAAPSLALLSSGVSQMGSRDVALLSFPTPSNPLSFVAASFARAYSQLCFASILPVFISWVDAQSQRGSRWALDEVSMLHWALQPCTAGIQGYPRPWEIPLTSGNNLFPSPQMWAPREKEKNI